MKKQTADNFSGILKRPQTVRTFEFISIAFVVIMAFVYSMFYVNNWYAFTDAYTPDEGNYIAMAKRLLETGVYSYWGGAPDAYVTPGFPMFLVVCMSVFGSDLQGIHDIKIVQACLLALTVLMVYFVGRLLTNKHSVGLIAALLVVLNGEFAFYTRFLLTETLYNFLMMLFFVMIICAWKKDKIWLYFLSGLALCAAVMVRPLIAVSAPFIVLFLVIKLWKQWKTLFLRAGSFILGFLVIALPWWIRNLVTMDQLIILATQTNPIYAGLAPDVNALGLEDPGTMLGNIKLLLELLITHPLQTIYWMTFGKFQIMFMSSLDVPYLHILSSIAAYSTVFLGLFGCFRALFSKRLFIPAVVFYIYFLCIFLFIPVSRYALSYWPLLAVGAGYLLSESFTSDKKQKV